jgi:hypothetical protein
MRRTHDGGLANDNMPEGGFVRADSGWTLIPMSGGRHCQQVPGHRIEADRAMAYAQLISSTCRRDRLALCPRKTTQPKKDQETASCDWHPARQPSEAGWKSDEQRLPSESAGNRCVPILAVQEDTWPRRKTT